MPYSRDDNQLASISHKSTLVVSDNSNDFKKLNVLSISTEWFSTHGGVSTVNRELCKNLSALGHSVICAVESPIENEKKDARDYGVHLIGPTKLSGLDDRQSLIAMPLILPKDTYPDIIIGHGVYTGPAALTQQRFFYGSRRIHFVHVDSGAIEPLKKNMDHGTRADKKIQKEKPLACSADLVVGIGPKLHKVAAHLILGVKPKPVLLRFDPGLTKTANVDDLPTRLIILIVGRMEDSYLKGLDIIAAALGKLWDEGLKEAPILRVRGAPANEENPLCEYLFKQMNKADIPIQVRPFSTEEDLLYHDLIEASLVVMPSREEGFGLVALEALEEARPLLVSDKSGFAELIKEILPEIADEVIVLTPKNTKNAVKKWALAIFNTLSNKQESFQKALKFQKEFVKKVTWKRSTRNLVSNILYHTKELTESPIPYYSFPKSQLITPSLFKIEGDLDNAIRSVGRFDYKTATKLLLRVLSGVSSFATTPKLLRLKARAMNELAKIQRDQGSPELLYSALKNYADSIVIWQELDEIGKVVKAELYVGAIHEMLRFYSKALIHYSKGLEAAKNLFGGEQLCGDFLLRTGAVFTKLGVLDKAEDKLVESLACLHNEIPEVNWASARLKYATLLLYKGKIDEAGDILQKALNVIPPEDKLRTVRALIFKTNLLLVERKMEEAISIADSAEQIAYEYGLRHQLSSLYTILETYGLHFDQGEKSQMAMFLMWQSPQIIELVQKLSEDINDKNVKQICKECNISLDEISSLDRSNMAFRIVSKAQINNTVNIIKRIISN